MVSTIIQYLRENRSQRIFLLMVLIAYLVSRSFPFRFSAIPLGYDAGLYRSMFLAYDALGGVRAFDTLPVWIQTMYEPLLGMRGALFIKMNQGWWDAVLTWGVVLCGLLPLLGVWIVARGRSKQTGWFAVLLMIGSFTQYQVFWRNYRKQLLAVFLFLVIVQGRNRGKILPFIPIIGGVFLLHRPTALLLLFVAVVRGVVLCVDRHRKKGFHLFISFFIAFLLIFPILLPFREELILPMIGPFLTHIDLPVLRDGFQQGGTFLTLREYLQIAGWLLLVACGALFLERKKYFTIWPLVIISFFVLMVWVFGQGFFFQRMLGFLDLFVLLFVAVWCAFLRSGTRRKKVLVVMILLVQFSIFSYRTYRTYRPLIESAEFAFLTDIGRHIEEDAYIIVPGIDYSPRVQGRTQREVLAPGLFDLNRWGTRDQERTQKRFIASAEEKCQRLHSDYPEVASRPVYLRIGSKQETTEIERACFFLKQEGLGRSRWQMKSW